MRRIAGVALVAVLTVSVPAFAEPAVQPPAAAPEAPPPAAAPAPVAPPAPQRRPWKEWLDREPPPISEPETKRVWYGWQNLLVDGLALSAIVLTASQGEDEGAVWVTIGLLGIGSPIVHFAHLNMEGGLASLAIRAASGGLFVLGVELSTNNSFDSSGDEETEGVALGVLGLLGVATSIVLDAAFFGFEEKPVPGQPRGWLTPWVDPERHRVGVGYAAIF